MSLALGIAIYVICWWIVLFAILPFGVKTQDEIGTVEPGTPGSAPQRPLLLAKFAATTVIASIVFAGIYVAIVRKPFDLNDIPFLPRFESPAGVEPSPRR